MEAEHQPVLLEETMKALEPTPGKYILDATFGRGGHARAMLERGARVVALDRDPDAEACARGLEAEFQPRFVFRRRNFSELAQVHAEFGSFDGILMDLGVSSPQLNDAERGFSFQQHGPLDMRMDPSQEMTAADLVNSSSEAELADLIFRLGEEREARRIARAIVQAREKERFTRTAPLAALVEKVLGGRRNRKIHPATKTFQALRIAVNGELEALEEALPAVPGALKPGGRFAAISFHALEDRRVKSFIERRSLPEIRGTEYAFGLPNPDYTFRKIGRWLPSEAEVLKNPRARSARLRVAEKLS
ncbi:MAG: 16S rRNA (cytosine(1402)-N(4))-methyltransferase RsmH [Methylacidiphilales bacterium]|nr:16S rRNA (cytosine(1402)-N(4))-methyltransferase RsmH [Candidatus Methylacidiphilales bacterium]